MENVVIMPNELQRAKSSFEINNGTFLNATYSPVGKIGEWERFLLLTIESLIIFGVFKYLLDFRLFQIEHLKTTGLLITLISCLAWWVFAFLPSHSYLKSDSSFSEGISFSNLWGPLLLHGGMVVSVLTIIRLPISYPLLFQSYVGITVLLILTRLTYQLFHYKGVQPIRGKFVIAGGSFHGQQVAATLAEKWGRDLFAGIFDRLAQHNENFSENFDVFKQYCMEEQVQHIYIALPAYQRGQIEAISQFAAQNFIRCSILPVTGLALQERKKIYFIGNVPVYDQSVHPLQKSLNSLLKRLFDIVFSLTVILTIFPWLMLIVGTLIKLSSPGPVFFVQLRPGKGNRTFKCFKFRTMRINNQTELQATKKDPRVTAIGQFLRKTSMDELPQFFNVLLGDMSIVGPRPNMIGQLNHYSKLIPEYTLRHAVPPDITGYAQVKGYRGETKQVELMQKRIDYDLAYIRKWNFLFDIKIIFLTVKNMIAGEEHAY